LIQVEHVIITSSRPITSRLFLVDYYTHGPLGIGYLNVRQFKCK